MVLKARALLPMAVFPVASVAEEAPVPLKYRALSPMATVFEPVVFEKRAFWP